MTRERPDFKRALAALALLPPTGLVSCFVEAPELQQRILKLRYLQLTRPRAGGSARAPTKLVGEPGRVGIGPSPLADPLRVCPLTTLPKESEFV